MQQHGAQSNWLVGLPPWAVTFSCQYRVGISFYSILLVIEWSWKHFIKVFTEDRKHSDNT